MSWSLKETRERAKYARQVGTYSTIVCLEDRAQLLALVDRIVACLKQLEEDAHVVDFSEEDRCVDCCPGCDADDLLREIDGGAE